MTFDQLDLGGEGPRYHFASRAAAEILNLYIHSTIPSPELYGRLLFIVLESMNLAEAELNRYRRELSRN